MTYDYSSPYNPGPNSPLKWIRSTLHLLAGAGSKGRRLAEKIFVGINFYGNDFVLSKGLGGGPIISHEYLSLLEQHKPVIQWEEDSAEHFFLYSDNQQVQQVHVYFALSEFFNTNHQQMQFKHEVNKISSPININ
ncbi:PREDICTED: chitinase domain-containing protein 1-like [Nicotiana attenuata]|uniref:Chitinase domain-containing protein 1 n=1 Tax=Nicotiana attenuata TaxID=49451 RepID=A0A314LBP1_NICAT|nr:PREDICTED: chitinase domain-containing protein 1-like [Nicotiana attenuata]OIT38537.1 hypothetical protein A4A49_18105 [Nicotiana attenuata]